MKIIDRYILRQFWASTLGIVLLFSCIVLLVQSIRIVDTVAHYGAGMALFFELAFYMMPRVLRIALPISAFIAVIHVINRLHGDSELFAIYTAGSGSRRLLRPVAAFAAGVALLTAIVTMLLAPWAAGEALDRRTELRAAIEPRLMRDGQFLNPRPGLTAFVRAIDRDRSLRDIFLYDRHQDGSGVTIYTAQRGWVQTTPASARLTLQKGMALEFGPDWNLVSRFSFDQFVQNLLDLGMENRSRKREPNEMFLIELLDFEPGEGNHVHYAKVRAEAHEQLSSPVYAFALPFLALASLLAGFNQARIPLFRISVTAALGVALVLASFSTKNIAAGTPEAAWVMYAPPLFVILGAVLSLLRARGWIPRRQVVR